MTSPLKSRQSPLLLITPGGVDCKIASKTKKKWIRKIRKK
jgi:hypothetical protein